MVLNKIGVTGYEGLVGSHLVPLLAKKNFKIIATSRKFYKNKNNVNHKKLDLSKKINENLLDKVFGDIDFFIHTAAILPEKKKVNLKQMKLVNLYNTKKLVDWACKKKIFFVFFSTISVFSKKNIYYIKCKKEIENYLAKKTSKFLIIRPSSIYGFGIKDKTFLFNKINKIKNNKKLLFYKPFQEKLNFIHAHDVSRAVMFLIKKKQTGSFNLLNEKNLSIKELIEIFKKIFKISNEKIKINYKNQKKSNLIKINKKKINKLGWRCKISIQNGIIESFVKEKIII